MGFSKASQAQGGVGDGEAGHKAASHGEVATSILGVRSLAVAVLSCLAFVLVHSAAPALAATGNEFKSLFTGSETAASSFEPAALAFNASGDVVVEDSEHKVVDEYPNSSGSGKPKPEVALSFNPYGIAVNSSGDLWVADLEGKAVVEFNSSGGQIAKISGAETKAKSFTPLGVAVNSSGDLYVADYVDHVVDELEPSGKGKPIAEFSTGEAGAEGVAVNASGDVYVISNEYEDTKSEKVPSVVDEFSSAGTLVREITGSETPQKSLGDYIPQIAVAPSGEVYIPDGEAGVVDRFGATGTWLSQFNGSETPQESFGFVGLAVNATGEVYVGDDLHKAVDIFSPAGVAVTKYPLTITKGGTGSGTAECNIGTGAGACAAEYPEGTRVKLTATAAGGSGFTGWSEGGCSGTGSCEVTMSAAMKVTATFNLEYPLTIMMAGTGAGTVECNTGSGAGVCHQGYTEGTKVTLTATPNLSSTFAGWSVAGQPSACPGTGSCEVTMSAEESVTATFNLTLVTKFPLTVTKAGTGTGTVECEVNAAGHFEACAAEYSEGTKLVLKGTAEAGSTFEGWTAGTGSAASCTGTSNCSFTIKEASGVTATFNVSVAPKDKLTVTKAGTGTGTVECEVNAAGHFEACAAEYSEGTKVKLTEAPAAGSTFAGWSEACSGTGSCEVTMSAAMKVTATFNLTVVTKYPLTVTKVGTGSGTVECNSGSGAGACAAEYSEGTKVKLTEAPAAGSMFAGWSEACTGTGSCEVTMSAAMKVTATFNKAATEYALTVTKAGTGTGTVECKVGAGPLGACAATYPEGTKVTLEAKAAAGSTFAGWSEACSGTGSCEVTMSAAVKVTATFNLSAVTKFPLTVTKAGTGSGTVECNSGSGAGACAGEYAEGTTVKLTEAPAAGSTFAGWSEACSGTGSCEVTMSAAMKVTATFNLSAVTKYPLTVTKAGTGSGTVECNSGSGAGVCAAEYSEGTKVKLTEAPAAGSTFAGWSEACSGTGACEVTMSAAMKVTATFNLSAVTKFPLTVTKAGTGSGTVECNTGSGVGVCAAEYSEGTKVKLTEAPAAGSTFAGWSEACSGTGSCEVTMGTAMKVTATFNLSAVTKYPLTVTMAGTGSGTVECNTGSGAGACAAEYSEGTKVKFTEAPAAGSTFAGWSEACSGTGSCEVTMSAAMKVTATFNLSAVTKFPLTVTKAGTGGGTVECNTGSGAGACAAEYAEGTTVKLTETPAAGSTFAGWSEACSGTGGCEVTMSAAMKVTATFNLATVTEYPLTITTAGSGAGTVQCNAGACAAKYPAGTKVTLTATAAAGSTFAGWSVSGQPGACPGTGSCKVTINAATSVIAWFNPTPVKFPLTVTNAGTGTGTVECNTGSGAGACASEYNEGTEVTLTATAAAGSTFAGWSGACSGTGSCEVTISAAKSVTATFTKNPPPKGKLKVPASATVSGGKALLNLSCSDAGVCAGELTLTIQIKQGHKLKTVVVGRASCHIAAGEVQTVKIKLSGVADKVLKQFRILDVTLTGPGGLKRTVKLKLKRS
jgi:hypothetical protein